MVGVTEFLIIFIGASVCLGSSTADKPDRDVMIKASSCRAVCSSACTYTRIATGTTAVISNTCPTGQTPHITAFEAVGFFSDEVYSIVTTTAAGNIVADLSISNASSM